jgi:hypothetical protein
LPTEDTGGVLPLRIVGTATEVVVEIAGPAAFIVLCNGIKVKINEVVNKIELNFL